MSFPEETSDKIMFSVIFFKQIVLEGTYVIQSLIKMHPLVSFSQYSNCVLSFQN